MVEVVVVVGLCARKTRGREGIGPKTCNQAAMAQLQAEMQLQEVEGGAMGLQAPLPC